MGRLVGFPTANGTVPVVDLRSLAGVPDGVLESGRPVGPSALDRLPDETVTYAD